MGRGKTTDALKNDCVTLIESFHDMILNIGYDWGWREAAPESSNSPSVSLIHIM